MVKRCIGIDIGSSYLRAAQISRTGEELHVEQVFSTRIRRSADSPPDVLRSLISKYGFACGADIAISMPHDAVFFRSLEADFAGSEQVNEPGKPTLEHNFPIPPDEIVAEAGPYRKLPDERYSALTAAVSRASLRERLNLLATAKMHANLVEPAIFAIHSSIAVNHPEIMTGTAIIAYVDERYLTLAVTQNNDILIVRNTPFISPSENNTNLAQEQIAEVLSREAQITWRKVFGSEVEEDTKVYLATGGNVPGGLEAVVEEILPCQIIIVDPYAKVKFSAEHNSDGAICLAEGLALRILAPEKTTGINFLEADNANIKPTLNLKKEFVICATLVATIAAISLAGLFMRLSHLETKYAHIKNEIREVFQRTLPDEKNIVSPLAQLEQKLESLRKDHQLFASFWPTGLAPLEVLRSITASTASQASVKIDDLLITGESVRLTGTCDSFESVYQWQRLLQEIPEFTLVDVQDVQREPKTGAIHFTILISLPGSANAPSRVRAAPAIPEQK